MISYELGEEHSELRRTVAKFAREVVAPVIGGYYERGEFPYEIVARMGKLGLFGLPFNEQFGGMGGDYFALCLALEELARVDSSVAITLEAAVCLGAMPLYRFGTVDIKSSIPSANVAALRSVLRTPGSDVFNAEFMRRLRSRAFFAGTVIGAASIVLVSILPSMLGGMASSTTKRIVLAGDHARLMSVLDLLAS